MRWDPSAYERFAGDRGRPFAELVARVGAAAPRAVVDLGCGPGELTSGLRERWPRARVSGVDSCPEMIARARERDPLGDWVRADLVDYRPEPDVDVVITNATLQWVPDHLTQVDRLVRAVPDDGWFAMQVPGNFGAPSHTLMCQVADQVDPSGRIAGDVRERLAAHDPAIYAEHLAAAGLEPDAWETTYLHRLPVTPTDRGGRGKHPVLTWVRGTGLRPWLAALERADASGALGREYLTAYEAALHEAYPIRDDAATLPFRRIFAVGHRPG